MKSKHSLALSIISLVLALVVMVGVVFAWVLIGNLVGTSLGLDVDVKGLFSHTTAMYKNDIAVDSNLTVFEDMEQGDKIRLNIVLSRNNNTNIALNIAINNIASIGTVLDDNGNFIEQIKGRDDNMYDMTDMYCVWIQYSTGQDTVVTNKWWCNEHSTVNLVGIKWLAQQEDTMSIDIVFQLDNRYSQYIGNNEMEGIRLDIGNVTIVGG